MVRYPAQERQSLGNLEDMSIRTSDGAEVPFLSVAETQYGNGFSSIKREDKQRIVNVTGDVNRAIVTPEEVMSSVEKFLCKEGSSFTSRKNTCHNTDNPGVTYSLGGEQEQRSKAVGSLVSNSLLALLLIYALLAIPLKSYMQLLVIMSLIPFGAVGAIVRHYIICLLYTSPSPRD